VADVRRTLRGQGVCWLVGFAASVDVLVVACGSSSERGSDFDVGLGVLVPRVDASASNDAEVPFNFTDDRSGEQDDVAACATETQRANPLPLDVHLMLDTSGSMSWVTASGASKWSQVRDALSAFANDPRSAGLRLAVSYFPIAKAGVPDTCTASAQCLGSGPCALNVCYGSPQLRACDVQSDCPAGSQCLPLGICSIGGDACVGSCPMGQGTCNHVSSAYCEHRDSCDAFDYATPSVPLVALPAGAAEVIASLNAHQPSGATPTGPALAGVLDAAHASAQSSPESTVVAVLATDGLPTVCATHDVADVAKIAASGVAATPSVRTFAVGVFTPQEETQGRAVLDQVATAGGTGQAFVLTTSQSVAEAFVASLNAIRLAAVSCEMTLPVPASGTRDLARVNVRFSPGTGPKKTLAYVATASACDAQAFGWYYDVEPMAGSEPSKIGLCSASCALLKGDPRGQIDVVLGCRTVVK
jgi:hypothetical protein